MTRLTLAPPFTSGMVLQRELPAQVWGEASPGSTVELTCQGLTSVAIADGTGRWSCAVGPLHASDAEVLEVRSEGQTLSLEDVAVGEVFIAGGQSNMEFWMRYDREVEQVRPTCTNPRIRFFDQPKCSYPGQTGDFDYSKVGLWRKATPDDLDYFSAIGYYLSCEVEEALDVPVGIVGCNYGGTMSLAWMEPDHARVVQPEETAAFEAKLGDVSYEELLANGRLNPSNDKGYATWPAWNELFLRGTPTAEEIDAFMAEQAEVGGLSLGGGAPADTGIMTPTKDAPGALFTHMVRPIAGLAARAVLWYQGESDDEVEGAAAHHARALATVISDWRAAWKTPDLPFLVVQLPGMRSWWHIVARDWPTIRACQQQVADEVEGVWLCSAGDMGEEFDIHPKHKRPIGHRLARLALAHLLGQDLPADAPRLVEATRVPGQISLRLSHAEDGLSVTGEEISALEVSCQGRPVPFEATAQADLLTLTLPEEASGEVEVRFAQTNWYLVNLFNGAGIPALPFSCRV